MKILLSTVSVLALIGQSACAQVYPKLPGVYYGGGGVTAAVIPPAPGGYVVSNHTNAACSQVPSTWGGSGSAVGAGTSIYVDPGAAGNDSNPGTLASPYKTLAKAVSVYAAGDTINLQGGTYSENFTITNKVNASWTRVQAVTGQVPIFPALVMDGSAKWFIQGVKIQHNAGAANFDELGSIRKGSAGAHNIVLDSMNFSTLDDGSALTQVQRRNFEYYGLNIQESVENDGFVTCIAVSRTLFAWVQNAMSLSGNMLLSADNEFSHLTGDNMAAAGQYVSVLRNYSHDERSLGVAQHNDFLQFQVGACPQTPYCTRAHVIVDGNIVIETSNAADITGSTEGTEEGLDCIVSWDQTMDDMTVTNNKCITSSSNLITLTNLYNSTVANNTAVNHVGSSGGGIQIALQGNGNINTAGAPNSHDDHIWNNVVSNIGGDGPTTTIVFDHNDVLVGGRFDYWPVGAGAGSFNSSPGTIGTANNIRSQALTSYFLTYVLATRTFDLHLGLSSAGVGQGTTPAPAKSDGTARSAPVDLGGY